MTKREAGYLTWLFIRPRRRLPLQGSLSSAFGAPLLQGAAPLAYKSATPKRPFLPDGKVNEMRIPLPPYRHFERSEKSLSFAVRQSMFGKLKTGNLFSKKPSGIATIDTPRRF